MGRTREESKENQKKLSVSSSSQEQGPIGLTLSGLLTNFHYEALQNETSFIVLIT